MSETYEMIIKEIEDYDTVGEYIDHYSCIRKDRDTNYFTDAVIHICERVRKAVAGSPREWFVKDANDNELHIGDKVRINGDFVEEVLLLGEQMVSTDTNDFYYTYQCELSVPDSQQDIISDLTESLLNAGENDPDNARHIAEMFADRFMKLGALK